LILLAFFFPLAVYLLILGALNRRRHPLLVSGVWDGIGLLFGVSGFLLFAGPAVFGSINERWRLYWLLGKGDVPIAAEGAWQFWAFLSILYFALVVGGSALLLWRQRPLTAVYNAEAAQIEQVLAQVCAELGLNPARSEGLFVFGLSSGRSGANGERVQAPNPQPAAIRAVGSEPPEPLASPTTGQYGIPDVLREQTPRHVALGPGRLPAAALGRGGVGTTPGRDAGTR
jgi:hypothetical protein